MLDFLKYSMDYQITQSNLGWGRHKIKALKNGKKWEQGLGKNPKHDTQHKLKRSSQKDHLALGKEHKLQQGGSIFHSAYLFCPCCTDITQISAFRQGVLTKFTVTSALLPPAYVQAMKSPHHSHSKQRSLFYLSKQWMYSKELQEDYMKPGEC